MLIFSTKEFLFIINKITFHNKIIKLKQIVVAGSCYNLRFLWEFFEFFVQNLSVNVYCAAEQCCARVRLQWSAQCSARVDWPI